MSGFEVVGVVLGALPLMIGAADTYRKGFEPLAKWMRFRTDFIKFIDTVDFETKMFNLTLERFLLSVNVPEDELRKLMTNPAYEGWENEELGNSMRAKLGTSLDVYMSTMKTMGDLMTDLQKLLSLKNDNVDWAKPGANEWDYQLKRLSNSFRTKGPKTVEELGKLNRKLKELLEVNDKLESMRASRKDTSWGTIFQSIRRHASSLHSAILKSWNCGCAAPHVATLALQQRKTGDWSSKFNMAFDIVEKECKSVKCREVVISLRKNADETEKALRTICVPNQTPERGQYLDTLRHDFKAMSTPNVNVISRPSPISSQSDPSPMAIQIAPPTKSHGMDSFSKMFSSKKPKVKKNVRMQIPSPCTLPATPRSLSPNSQDPALIPTPTPIPITEEIVEIKNLCAILRAPHSGCMGYIKDEKRQHELRCLSNPENEIEHDAYVTLETVLGFTGETKVSRRQRYKIASILASSLLQLHSTPWIIDKISKTNVLFPKVNSKVLVSSPFMRCTFSAPPSNQDTPAPTRPLIKSALRNLAIVLLELCYGEPIESNYRWPSHLGQDGKPHDSTDFLTAEDWLEAVRDEEPELVLVVERCLYGHFEERKDWGNIKFLQAFYAGVVEPLEKLEKLGGGA